MTAHSPTGHDPHVLNADETLDFVNASGVPDCLYRRGAMWFQKTTALPVTNGDRAAAQRAISKGKL